jgi:hypothetical protein
MQVQLVNDGPVTLTLDTAHVSFERAMKKEGRPFSHISPSPPPAPSQEGGHDKGEAQSDGV